MASTGLINTFFTLPIIFNPSTNADEMKKVRLFREGRAVRPRTICAMR